MPRYDYKCGECGVESTISHSIHDKLTYCGECKTEKALFRMVSDFNTTGLGTKTVETKQKPGKVVNEFIEKTKREVFDYKRSMEESVSDVDSVGE